MISHLTISSSKTRVNQ